MIRWIRSLLLAALLLTQGALAADLAPIAGHWQYTTDYHVIFPDGRVMGLEDLGMKRVWLDVSAGGTITMRIEMLSGQVITETAKVLKAEVTGGAGFWIAQWPDMNYPVRAQVKYDGSTLATEIKFENQSDSQRFGSVEKATLRRVDK